MIWAPTAGPSHTSTIPGSGHEFSAEVIEADENNAYGIRKGMIVTCNPYFNCGHCYSCQHGTVNACMDNQTMGCQRDGAFQEYITMPIERVYDGKGWMQRPWQPSSPSASATTACSGQTSRQGEKVLVVGAGTIGVLAAVAAKAKGAEVTICDVAPDKLEYACRTFGLDHKLLNESPEAFAKGVAALTDGNGFDVTIEAVGMPETFMNCIDAACFGGRVVLIGVSKRNIDDFFFTIIQKKELNIYGSRNALKQDFEELIELVGSGKIDLDKIVTNEYNWTDAPQAFEEFSANAGKMLKVVLNFTV